MRAPAERAPIRRAVRKACHPWLSVRTRALWCPRSMLPLVVLRLIVSGCFAASSYVHAPCVYILDDAGRGEAITGGQSGSGRRLGGGSRSSGRFEFQYTPPPEEPERDLASD